MSIERGIPNGHDHTTVTTVSCPFCGTAGITEMQVKRIEARTSEIEAKWKKDADDRVNAEKKKRFAENLKLQQELENMRRRLAKERPNELGDDGELSIYRLLSDEFAGQGDDIVERVGKFVSGPDIVHRVMQDGVHCGTIVYDSKNGSAFLHKWVSKIADDRKVADAAFAVIVTAVMPRDSQQLALVDDGVVVALPARTLVVAHLLRQQIVATYRLRLSAKGRIQKTARVYALLTSDETAALWDRHAKQIEALITIEQADGKHQEKTRAQRLQRIETLRSIVHDQFLGEVNRLLIGGKTQ
jgi:hypothetical protein